MRVSYLGSSESSVFIHANSVKIPLYDETLLKEVSILSDTIHPFSTMFEGNTFYVRVQDELLNKDGIYNQDILVVDRSLVAHHGDFVIACIEGVMRVKELELEQNASVRPKNKAYRAIDISKDADFDIFGVVVSVIRNVTGNNIEQ